jgi:hypothetical protein
MNLSRLIAVLLLTLPVTLHASGKTPTYHGHIEHIIQRSCLSCHRAGGVAPFALDSYETVKSRAKMLQQVVQKGIMPPWFAASGSGPWRDDRSLPASDRKALQDWIAGGMPRGNPSDAPAPVTFPSTWTIGTPDAVFQLPAPIAVKAEGIMPYQNIQVPTGFTEDRWVQKIEVIPGDRRVVHHVLVFARSPETAGAGRLARFAEGVEELSGFFGIYVPGNSALIYPEGMAKRIPKGAVLRFQIHYTPNGKATTDQTKIGLVFAKQPPRHEVHTASLANLLLSIPPKAANHEVKAQLRVPMDVQVLSYLPHMHLRGKAARYELVDQTGKRNTLIDIPRYDFNWQLNYVLREPLPVKAGSQLIFTAWYDNSEQNPANPDPGKTVRWGAQTYDEMHLGYVEYIIPDEVPGTNTGGLRRRRGVGEALEPIFRRLDRNNDGFLIQSEVGAFWNRLQSADRDGDGKVTLEEAKSAFGGAR